MKKNLIMIELGALGLLLTSFSNYIIDRYFPDRVVSPDLLFKILPHSIPLEYAADLIFIIGVAVFIFQYVIPSKKNIYDILVLVAIMYIARALFMILTPLMRPTGVDFPSHGIFRDMTAQLGMFPSGHIGLLALMYFLIEGKEYSSFKKAFLYILIFGAVLMVASKGHYSIDIVGGIMLSYIIVNEYNKYRSTGKNIFNSSQVE